MDTSEEPSTAASVEFPVAALLSAILRHWPALVASSFLGALLGVLVTYAVTPMYAAEVVVVSTRSAGTSNLSDLVRGLGALSGVVGAAIENTGELERDLALIRSRAFTLDFIEQRDLLPEMFPGHSNDSTGPGFGIGPFRRESRRREPTRDEIFRAFDARRRIQSDADTGIVTIRMEWTTPDRAADLANDLIRAANQYARSRVAEESRRSIEYLNRQLAASNVLELREMLYGLYEEQTKRAMLAEVREDFIFSVIDPAVAQEKPVRPRPLLYTASGTFAGFLLGLMFVTLRTRAVSRSETR